MDKQLAKSEEILLHDNGGDREVLTVLFEDETLITR